MKPVSLFLLACLMLLPLLLSACKKAAPIEETKPTPIFRKDGSLDILAPDGSVKTSFDLEIVESESEVRQGLKYRDTMADNQAMLFILDGQAPSGFWMQDTYLSLDMLFIDHEKNIFQIETHTKPFSEDRIEPTKINKYTLEIKAGIAEKLNIQKGDKIRWQKNQLKPGILILTCLILLLGVLSCKQKDTERRATDTEDVIEDDYSPQASSEAADSAKAAGAKANVNVGSTIANYKYTWTDTKDIPPLVIIIDDFGQTAGSLLDDFSALPKEVAFAILPDLPKTVATGKLAAATGHDVLIHLPMQALASGTSPGKRYIATDSPTSEITAMLSDFYAQLPMAVASNNHMGSAATQNEAVMNAVLDALASKGMFFIDSATSANRLAYNLAKSKGLRSLRRDIFLDVPDNSDATIAAKIQSLGRFAGRREPIVIISHCHNREKLVALQKFIAQIQAMGLRLMSVSQAQGMA